VFDTLEIGVYNAPNFFARATSCQKAEDSMDSTMKQLARELTDAVSAAVSRDPRVEACREKARAAGYDMRVSLEAVVSFTSRETAAGPKAAAGRRTQGKTGLEMSANDRRFLKSLRIAADETTEEVE
jgi:hypothetical protein